MRKIPKEEDLDCNNNFEAKRILMKMDKEDIIDRYFYRYERLCNIGFYIFVIVLIIGVVGGCYFVGNISKNAKELGQAICEERFDKDFDSYDNKELKCKDKEVKEQYDGITIQIK